MKVCMAQKQRKPAWRKSRGSLHDAKAEEACMQYKRGNQHAAKALKPALCKKALKLAYCFPYTIVFLTFVTSTCKQSH